MTRKEKFLFAVLFGSVAVTLLYYTGLNTKLLFELVVLGTIGVSMVSKTEKLKETPGKALASKIIHVAALVIFSGCFLWEAGMF